jgi:hypothetical protein
VPSVQHDGIVRVFEEQPVLFVELLRKLGRLPADSLVAVEPLSADLTSLAPAERRADVVFVVKGEAFEWAGIVEVQRAVDPDKVFQWPAYLVELRARRRCPVVMVVVATTREVAQWASRPVDLGFGEVRPWVVVGPGDLPVPGREEALALPELAVLAATLRRGAPDEADVAQLALEAAAGLPEALGAIYTDIIWASLGEQAQQILEARMSTQPYEFQSDFAKKYIGIGREEGREEGMRRLLRRLLEERFGPLGDAHAAKLTAGTQPQLERWATRLLSADGIDAALADE